MSSVGYLVAAYVGAALLYVGYVLWLLRQERAIEGRGRGPAR